MSLNDSPLYFDYAAATPMDPVVLEAMKPYFTGKFYNPSATYIQAKEVHKDLEAARSKIALIIGSRSNELVFTAGGTEANNLAIQGVMRLFSGSNVVVSSIEHESILRSVDAYDSRQVPVSPKGIVELDRLVSCIDDETVLVSIMYANNEIGTVQSIRSIAQVIRDIRKSRKAFGNDLPLYFHTDAAQAASYLDLHVSRLGVDMMTLNGGKIYGPKQSGVLFVSSNVKLKPIIFGGGQERGLRSGTENVAGAVGFATALELAQERRHEESSRMKVLQDLFISQLSEQLPQVVINGSLRERLPNNVHITTPGQDNERLILELELKNILCAAGSACSASDVEPSHVLKALGLDDEVARSSLRFSMGRQTDEAAVRRVVAELCSLLK